MGSLIRLRNWLQADERAVLRHVVALKIVVMLGMIAAAFVPAEYAVAAGLATNILWLWKL